MENCTKQNVIVCTVSVWHVISMHNFADPNFRSDRDQTVELKLFILPFIGLFIPYNESIIKTPPTMLGLLILLIVYLY